ncbi:MAG TPA: hypothetical protein VI916_08220 [Acidimicrobiia bacterium]|nr:hypothetical protein [Acidimicrobiia bacterium]
MIAPFVFDREYEFPVSPETLWKTLDRTDQFPRWWRWLRAFDADGVTGLEEGARAHCVVRGPLPYSLRFTVAVERVVPGQLIETRVSGDIEGPARLELRGSGVDSAARLVWSVSVVDPALRATARAARPLMEWGHNWVVTRGVRAFRQHALARR